MQTVVTYATTLLDTEIHFYVRGNAKQYLICFYGYGQNATVFDELAAHLKDEKTCRDLIAYALTQGVFTDWFLYAPHALRIAPPLTITDEEITFACETIVNFLNFQD